jgi:hypothetical protein
MCEIFVSAWIRIFVVLVILRARRLVSTMFFVDPSALGEPRVRASLSLRVLDGSVLEVSPARFPMLPSSKWLLTSLTSLCRPT